MRIISMCFFRASFHHPIFYSHYFSPLVQCSSPGEHPFGAILVKPLLWFPNQTIISNITGDSFSKSDFNCTLLFTSQKNSQPSRFPPGISCIAKGNGRACLILDWWQSWSPFISWWVLVFWQENSCPLAARILANWYCTFFPQQLFFADFINPN